MRDNQALKFNNCPLPTAYCPLPGRERGFTLLELVMVMTIIVILAAVSVTSYQQIQLKAKETILREDIRTLNRLIDQYCADKEGLPQSLDDLVSAHYMHEIPIDPITGQADWVVEMAEDPCSRDGGQGIDKVRSNAPGEGSDGIAYKDYGYVSN
jgi:general secretion pathway protein G